MLGVCLTYEFLFHNVCSSGFKDSGSARCVRSFAGYVSTSCVRPLAVFLGISLSQIFSYSSLLHRACLHLVSHHRNRVLVAGVRVIEKL